MLHVKPWEHPGEVATLSVVILLSAKINYSTHSTAASVAISTGQTVWISSAMFEHPSENSLTQL
jgi:hypothetical protein